MRTMPAPAARRAGRRTAESRPLHASAGTWRRLWRLPLAAHAAIAMVLLGGAAAWIGPGASFTSDEGASVLQARAIEHGSWTVPDPLPAVDPGGTHYPVALSARGTRGFAPLGKHLFYGLVLAVADRVLGPAGMVLLSMLGTVTAALLAAALSRRLRGGGERPTFWFIVLATPLLFDGLLLVAQSLGAAAVAASALLALRYLDGPARRDRDVGGVAYLAGAAACCALACLLRTEAVLWCVGLAAAVLLSPSRKSATGGRRGRVVALAGAVLGAAAVARKADTLLTAHAIGARQTILSATPAGGHSVGDRLHAGFVSWFQAGSDPFSLTGAAVVVALVAVAVAMRMLRRRRASSAGLAFLTIAFTAVWMARLAAAPGDPVYGLAAATPLVWAGLWLLDRSVLSDETARLCVVAPAVFSILVLATQYTDGGGLQWGGRFFAVALPVAAPLALDALARHRAVVPAACRQVVAAGTFGVVGLTVIGALVTLHDHHRESERVAETVGAAVSPGVRPLVVTSDPVLPRLEWSVFGRVRWQVVPLRDLPAFGTAARRDEIAGMLLVTTDPVFEPAALAHSYQPEVTVGIRGAPGWYLVTLSTN